MTTQAHPAPQYVRVAVERGIDRYPDGLTYRVDAAIGAVVLGDHIEVPLGRGDSRVEGVVVATGGPELLDRNLDPKNVKAILGVDRSQRALPETVVRLAQWISSYYCAPLGVTLMSITPSAVRKGVGSVRRLLVDLASPQPAGTLHPKRRAVIDTLSERAPSERPVDAEELRELCGLATRAPIQALIKSGHLTASHRSQVQARWKAEATPEASPPQPTNEQAAVLSAIEPCLAAGFSQHLLFGVTGSGKTEVYLRLAQRVLESGRSVLFLVPEIALTPQTCSRISARLPMHPMAILHSGLTQAQRHEQWLASAQTRATIVVGARSAVFAPIPEGVLGLVIVDEEHDSSYKQDQAPRYHGRDVAIRRAQLAKCPVLLGSATPSLESWWNATSRGLSSLHTLKQRAPGLRNPRVEIIDFRVESRLRPDRRVHLVGPTMELALRRAFDDGGQAIVLLNRRGYANWIACPDQACGWMMRCDHCEVGMVVHLRSPEGGALRTTRCHHCQAQQKVPTRCPRCSKGVSVFGLGTQRVEEELSRLFPDIASSGGIVRVDSDTMSTASDFHRALGGFARGEVRLLLGTQMIAKGLDYPNVRVVGVISADTALNLPDFRASERTFQLVSQVSGRCGRGDNPGRAIIQTFQPDAAPILAAAAQNYARFAKEECAIRERYGLPPATRMARIVVRHAVRDEAERVAKRLSADLTRVDAAREIEVRGPAPCPIARIADRWRFQIELIAPTAAILQRMLAASRSAGILVPGETVAVDVDPVALL
ncbi:MAG: primosomal protein N' [Phycisphaerales bacterium]|nr:primosomal protein N' [Phycisphaerales bacterium]